jgi:uridine monophosphate synthetase
VVVIDDIVTDGASKLEAIEPLEAEGLVVEDLVVLVDREQGARERLLTKGYRLHAVLTISECFDALEAADLVEPALLARAREFVHTTRLA